MPETTLVRSRGVVATRLPDGSRIEAFYRDPMSSLHAIADRMLAGCSVKGVRRTPSGAYVVSFAKDRDGSSEVEPLPVEPGLLFPGRLAHEDNRGEKEEKGG